MDILECGKVLNTHGVRGEIKVENYCDEGFFKKIKKITVGGTEYKIKAARDHGAFILLTLEGIENIDQAMLLKNKAITIPRADLKLKKGESVERGLKRLKKILDKEGIIKTLRDQRYFEKPCVKARKKSARARIRNRSRRRSQEM